MKEMSNEVSNLVNVSGKSASNMTQALKNLGDGNMQSGINFLGSYFENIGYQQGIEVGERRGFVKGSLVIGGACIVMGVVSGIYTHFKNKQQKQETEELLNKESNKIAETFEKDAENETVIFSEYDNEEIVQNE